MNREVGEEGVGREYYNGPPAWVTFLCFILWMIIFMAPFLWKALQ